MNRPLRSLSIAAALAAVLTAALPTPASADSVPLLPVLGGFQDGFYVPINDASLGGLGDDAQVTVNGNLAVSWAGSDFEGEVNEDGVLQDFRSGINLRGAATLEVGVDIGGELSGSLLLATIPLGLYPIAPGVDVTPYASVRVRLSGSADAGARASMVAPFDLDTAFRNNGSPQGSTTSQPRFEPQFGAPDAAGAVAFDGSITLEISLTFLTTISGFPVGGPVLHSSLGMELLVDPTLVDEPWWDLNGIVKVEGGWALPLPEGAQIPELADPLVRLGPVLRWDIADAGSEPPAGADHSTRWSTAFDIGRDDTAMDAVPTDNGVLVADDGSYPWLAELDGLGNATWQTDADQSRTARAMERADNGDLLVVGVPSIVRYGPAGLPLWARTLEVPTADTTTWTTVVAKGNSAILGGYSTDSGTSRPVFAELDQFGNLIWGTEVDTGPNSTNGQIMGMASTSNGDLIAVGSVDYEDPNTTDYWTDALVLRVRDDGTVLGGTALGTDLYDEDGYAIAVHDDDSYAISGRGHSGDGDPSWVVAFRPDHSVRWSATYASDPDIGVATTTGIAAPAEGGYVISGTNGSSHDTDSWLIRVDPDGMPVWSKTYTGPESDHLEGVRAVDDGFVAFGGTESTDNDGLTTQDLWIVRTNIDGMVHFDADSGFDAQNGAAQWHAVADEIDVLTPANIIGTPLTVSTPTATNSAANAVQTPLT